jgi:2-polyprenyl-6-methoxyphenol hydroxylase-like FAD-dependent oxidoreductase
VWQLLALRKIEHRQDKVTGLFEYVPAKNGATVNGHGSPNLDIQAAYLVGCDGANSAVRNLMEITCTDLGFENDWLVLDLVG